LQTNYYGNGTMEKKTKPDLDVKNWHKDKKRHGKTWEVIRNSKKPFSEFDRIVVDDKEYKFGKRTGAMHIKDAGVVKEMKEALGNEIVAYEVEDIPYSREERDHKWFHAVPELPWHKEKE